MPFLHLLVFAVLFLFGCAAKAQSWNALSDSAKKYTDQRKSKEALHFYYQAKDLLKKDSFYTNTYLQVCRGIANIYINQQENEKALPLFIELKDISSSINGKDAGYASIINVLASLYNNIGENNLSETLHLEARAIRERLFGKKDSFYAQSCNNLGALYWSTGKYAKAEALILEAKSIRASMPPAGVHPQYAITCVNLANLYRDMGLYEKAEELYIIAKNIRSGFEPVKQHLHYANSCNILADLYYMQGSWTKAEPLYLEAKAIREKNNKLSYIYGQSCNNLAFLYLQMGAYEKAEALALEAKDVYEKTLEKGHPSLTINMNSLGELYQKMGQYKKAEAFYLQARSLWEKSHGKRHPYYTSNTQGLARLYWVMKERDKAAALYFEAAEANYDRIQAIFEFTSEAEKGAYLKNVNGSLDEYFSFFYNASNPATAAQPLAASLLNRNLILSSSRQLKSLINESADTSLINQYDEWTALKQTLSRLYTEAITVDSNKIKKLEDQASLLEKKLARSSNDFKKAQDQKPDWRTIQNALSSTEVAIEFIDFNYYNGERWTDSSYYAAIIIQKGRQPVFIPLFEKKEFQSLVSTRGSTALLYTRGAGEDESIESNGQVYDLVWKQLEKELKGIKTIYFSPSGNLHRISFAALPLPDKTFLSDHYNLYQLNSIYSVSKIRRDIIKPTDQIKLYGGVQYDTDNSITNANKGLERSNTFVSSLPEGLSRGESWTYLPGTKKEVTRIHTLGATKRYSIQSFEGIDATEETIKAMSGKASPAVLHIATHGFFFPNTQDKNSNAISDGKVFRQSDNPLLRSGLLFTGANNSWKGQALNAKEDGILTALEVGNLFLPRTSLVVLSACETALGDIQGSEGVYGLQRAFKMAGVQNLVMSLWKVPDAETAEFMEAFYSNLFSGSTISESFRRAQSAMRNKYRNDPYKWAAWILVQ